MKKAGDMIRSARLVQDEAHTVDCFIDDDGDVGLTQKNGTDRHARRPPADGGEEMVTQDVPTTE